MPSSDFKLAIGGTGFTLGMAKERHKVISRDSEIRALITH